MHLASLHDQELNAFNNINDRMHSMSPVILWISYFRDEGEKLTTNPHDYPASVDGQGAARYTVPAGRHL